MAGEVPVNPGAPQLAAVEKNGGTMGLPTPRTPLVGRGHDIARGRSLLVDEGVALLTLTGPGGVGKTRLALAIAHTAATEFADGVVFVDLAPLTTLDQIVPHLARLLGIPDAGEPPSVARIITSLRPRQTLLVLDNCEHLMAGIAPLAGELLPTCPAVQILATSRAPLRVRGEQEWSVPPLAIPSLAWGAPATPEWQPEVEELAHVEAVSLFVLRARAVEPGFTLTGANAAAVAEICTRLDGLPLAIELAAARSRSLSPQALLALLSDRLRLLTSGARDAPARQRTLRDAIGWSYELLDAEAQALFRTLGVFTGGAELVAAAAVTSSDPVSVVEQLEALIDHSLVRVIDGPDGRRFTMLETIREYALERLSESGEETAVRDAHARYFLGLAEAAAPHLSGPEEMPWLSRLERNYPNLRAALGWLVRQRAGELAWRLAGALFRYWQLYAEFAEGQQRLEEAMSLPKQPTAAWARAQTALGYMVCHFDDLPRARQLLEEAVAVWPALGDRSGLASTLSELMAVELNAGDLRRANALGEEAVGIVRALGDDYGTLLALHILGVVSFLRGDLPRAQAELEESVALATAMGSQHERAAARSLGWVAVATGDVHRARLLWEERLTWAREHQLGQVIAGYLDSLGVLALRGGDLPQASAHFAEELLIGDRLRDPWYLARGLAGLGMASAQAGQAARAARLFGTADAAGIAAYLDGDIHYSIRPLYEQGVASVRNTLGADAFETAWRGGHELPRPHAVAEGLAFSLPDGDVPGETASELPALPGSLTRREREVLRLLTERQTDQEIADVLFVSRRTVSSHVTQILDKLGVENRRQAAATALRFGLV